MLRNATLIAAICILLFQPALARADDFSEIQQVVDKHWTEYAGTKPTWDYFFTKVSGSYAKSWFGSGHMGSGAVLKKAPNGVWTIITYAKGVITLSLLRARGIDEADARVIDNYCLPGSKDFIPGPRLRYEGNMPAYAAQQCNEPASFSIE
jgi:hypothetical protein